jgi:hypothetical protein
MCTQQHFKVYPATKHLRSRGLAVTARSRIIPLAGARAVAASKCINIYYFTFLYVLRLKASPEPLHFAFPEPHQNDATPHSLQKSWIIQSNDKIGV